MKHLIERAIDHAVDVADRDDKEEMVRMMRDIFLPTLEMLNRDLSLMRTYADGARFERAFEESGDAEICRAILGEVSR